jgi:hypothetical protein
VSLCPGLAFTGEAGVRDINISELGFEALVKSPTMFPGSSEISTSDSGRI